MTDITRADYCVIACAEAFRGDGEIMASPMAPTPKIGANLARMTFEPDLVLTDGVASLVSNPQPLGVANDVDVVEGWMPYREVFRNLWSGKRHVIMGATQIDQYGNQNISCIGDFAKPKVQLLGVRGAPGNTICHTTSYWVPRHSARVFVEHVDVVSGVGYDRAAQLSEANRRFHEIRHVISNLGVFDFETPDHRMRVRSLHPGVTLDEVRDNTSFDLVVPGDVPVTREPTAEELRIIRETLDPKAYRLKEVA